MSKDESVKPKSAEPQRESDEVVDKMIETWDEVRCSICGRKVSMLKARMVDNRYWICQEHLNERD